MINMESLMMVVIPIRLMLASCAGIVLGAPQDSFALRLLTCKSTHIVRGKLWEVPVI